MRARSQSDAARAFAELDVDEWQTVLDVNLTGTLKSLQACVAAMLDQGSTRDASLITIASIAAKHPDAGSVPYGVSKAGVWYLGWGQLCESFMGPVQPESVVFYCLLGLGVAQVRGQPEDHA